VNYRYTPNNASQALSFSFLRTSDIWPDALEAMQQRSRPRA
jgi:hypothetical protein